MVAVTSNESQQDAVETPIDPSAAPSQDTAPAMSSTATADDSKMHGEDQPTAEETAADKEMTEDISQFRPATRVSRSQSASSDQEPSGAEAPIARVDTAIFNSLKNLGIVEEEGKITRHVFIIWSSHTSLWHTHMPDTAAPTHTQRRCSPRTLIVVQMTGSPSELSQRQQKKRRMRVRPQEAIAQTIRRRKRRARNRGNHSVRVRRLGSSERS